MRFIYRWIPNALAFYLGLYLVDTLISPHFYVEKGWVAIVLSVLLSCINSVVRPFRHFKTKRNRALGWFALTALANYLFMQIISWVGAPLTGNPIGIMLAAVFLTLLGSLMNHVVGFKPKKQPEVITRGHRLGDATRERLAEPGSRRREKLRRPRR